MNTSIIIAYLDKESFIKEGRPLSLVDQIKLQILNYDCDGDEDYFINKISHWSNLPFLNRVIITLKDEASSKKLYDYINNELRSKLEFPEGVKVSLQENLLRRTKSYDNLDGNSDHLNSNDLKKFKALNTPADIESYQEPKPKKFDLVDLEKLGINIDDYVQQGSKDDSTIDASIYTPKSPTRILYKPALSIKTDTNVESSPLSPSITLDED